MTDQRKIESQYELRCTQLTLQLRCGASGIAPMFEDILTANGFSLCDQARHVVIVDEPVDLNRDFRHAPCQQLIIATNNTSPVYLDEMNETGAIGIIPLLPLHHFLAELRLLIEGQCSPLPYVSPLAPVERETAKLIAMGLSNKAIAQQRSCSPNVVKNTVKSIFRKLNLKSRIEVTHYYFGNWSMLPGVTAPDESP